MEDFNLPQWLQLLLPHASRFSILDVVDGLLLYEFEQQAIQSIIPPLLVHKYPNTSLNIVLGLEGYAFFLFSEDHADVFYPAKFKGDTICQIPDWPSFCIELRHAFDDAIAHWDQLEKDDILGEQPGMDDPCSVSFRS